ncbi:hypothetical protein [Mesoterricola sediminis]|uniref:Uncharacterized protein n=1 Tax=Mesoterricola sediminis TaxID=2927980 RepID=A0AA48GTC2_9BACT|nr:hypothetical protein [Mesoterricola sediminis]BDU77217.1 hypothetical protein METESE_21750 [Mesoterricola sediminis]
MRGRQRGAALLLAVAGLLALAAPALLLLHGALLRAWAMEGQALMGLRADLAAEDLRTWFLETGWPAYLGEAPVEGAAPPAAFLNPGQGGRIHVRPLGCLEDGRPLWEVDLDAWLTGPGGDRWTQGRQLQVAGIPPVLLAWRTLPGR